MGRWLFSVGGALLLFGLVHPASAATLAGVTMPDVLRTQGQTLRLNGMGLRTFTFLRVHGFVAGLYVAQPSHDASQILAAPGLKVLQIRFLRSAGVSRVQDQFKDGRAKNCTNGCPKSEDAAFAQLLATARPVQAGDTITYLYGPEGLTVLFNDKLITVINNPDFARRMLDGMIGPYPPTRPLRDGLLGQ